jgi:hypothetical protein
MPLHFQAQPSGQGHMQVSSDSPLSESHLRQIWQLFQQGQYQASLHPRKRSSTQISKARFLGIT